MKQMEPTHLDPVEAYDRLAPKFGRISERRRAYLTAIERLIASEIPADSRTLLDVGAGDATRACRIAQAANINHLVLLEPSAQMRAGWPGNVEHWPFAAEGLVQRQGSFDVILCLWNTLGHIFPGATRMAVLSHCARLLASRGRMFIDFNYRYNARHYGLLPTIGRALYDAIRPAITNGDVKVSWEVDGTHYTTDGHVFTQREFRNAVHLAGLEIIRQFSVDYGSGKQCRFPFTGNPLYVLTRS